MMRSLVALLAVLACCEPLRASERHLTSADLSQIKHICTTLLGAPAQARDPWLALAPYTRGRDDLDRIVVVCSAECSGSLRLVDTAVIYFTHPNTPAGWPGAGRDRIDSITLVHHGKTLLSLPSPKT